MKMRENIASQVDVMYPIGYIQPMKVIHTTDTFDAWFDGLRDRQARVRVQMRIDRAEAGNYGDHKAVGEGVMEMRINTGPGYRVYFIERGLEIVILLAGGDKSNQSADIQKAQALAREIKGIT